MIEYKKGIIEEKCKNISGTETYRKKYEIKKYVIALDIETSSWFEINGKQYSVEKYFSKIDDMDQKERKKTLALTKRKGCMYLWTIAVEDIIFFGRDYESLISCLNEISEKLGAGSGIIIWVQNLAFEMQFLKKRLNIVDSFALDKSTPIYVMLDNGIIFRDTLAISGCSLSKMGEEVGLEKLVGDLNYFKIRHAETPLFKEEMEYASRDVEIIVKWIRFKREIDNGKISFIPLTLTGYARREMRNACLYNSGKETGSNWSYRKLINSLKISCEKEYEMLKKSMRGGFVHASSSFVSKTVKNVHSFDYISKYLSVMLTEEFPMSTGRYIENPSKKDLKAAMENLSLITIEFFGLTDKFCFEHYLSVSTCDEIENAILDNGRIVSCSYCKTTMTNIDLSVMLNCYDYKNVNIKELVIYDKKGYLPRPFIKKCLDLYETKTKYKNVNGKEVDYTLAKIKVNSMFGLLVEDIGHTKWEYENAEIIPKVKGNGKINEYNNSRARFTFYPWGIFVSAFSRRDLWEGIFELGEDYIYSDTDSLKFVNYEKHQQYFRDWNLKIAEKSFLVCEKRGFNKEKLFPKDVNGTPWFLGFFADEGESEKFKTLGAKRYIQQKDGKIKITIAGVGKEKGGSYFANLEDPLEAFGFNTIIPRYDTGKLVHLYSDEEIKGLIIDYLGNIGNYDEKSFIHLSPSEYKLGLEDTFESYLEIMQ